MNVKVFLGLFIIFAGSILGNIFGAKYKRKSNFYLALEGFAVQLRREISFSSETLIKIISSYNTENNELKALLNGFCEGNLLFPEYFNESEKIFLRMFFEKLGRSDRKNEDMLISNFISDLKKYSEAETEKSKKYSALSTRLGFLCGLALFVMII